MAPKEECFCGQHSGHVAEIKTCAESRKDNADDHQIIFALVGKKVSMTLFLWVMAVVVAALGSVFAYQQRTYDTMQSIARDVAVIMERTKNDNYRHGDR